MTKKTVSAQSLGISNLMVTHDAIYVIEKLHKHGYDGYIVGGGVRDLLLGKTPKDFDIVTNATPEQVRKVFKRQSIIIGRRFKIVHVIFDNINPDKMIHNRPLVERHIIEISTYRSSKILKHTVNEHGKITDDNNYGSQKEDAFRRDFTINAMFYDPVHEIVIDYTDGIRDVTHKTIRIIGDPHQRYTEDPVRMLRAFRLSVKLGLDIEPATLAPFADLKHLLTHENKSRMYEEMLKILLSGSASACIKRLYEVGLPHNVFGLFDKLFFKPHPDELALKVIEKTDLRLKETTDVSLVFILAGLMWGIIYTDWQEMLKSGESPRQCLSDSIYKHKEQAYQIGITKYTYGSMREVWLLQLEFEAPNLKRIGTITATPRFRQAWHLFGVRNELGQVDKVLYDWWERFITAEDNNVKIQLHEELKTLNGVISETVIAPKKKRKRRRFKGKNKDGME